MKKFSLFSLLLFGSFGFSQCKKVYSLPETYLNPSTVNAITTLDFWGDNSRQNERPVQIEKNKGSYVKMDGVVTNYLPNWVQSSYFINGIQKGKQLAILVNAQEGYDPKTMGYYEVWVDYNGDGLFDNSERLSQGNIRNVFFVNSYAGVPYPSVRVFRSASMPINFDSCGPNSASDVQAVDLLNGNSSLATEQYENKSFSIYPNPAKDHITIDCGTLTNVVGYSIKIVNTLGQEVFNKPMNTQQYYVPLNSWGGQGMYFVNVIDAQGHTIDIKKIILQ
jgi:hypothetical protein